MSTLFDPIQRKKQLSRLYNLQEDSIPAWGRLTAGDLLPHLGDPMRIALGDLGFKPMWSIYGTKLGKWVAIYGLPRWPRSPITHPITDITKQGRRGTEFEKDMQELVSILERFVKYSTVIEFKDHPVFGKISNQTWGYLMNKHFEHHFRQFGL